MLSILLRNIKNIILGWAIIVPLAWLVPKKKNLVLFIGRFQGRFFGNVKFLYLYLHSLGRRDIEYYFFTEHKSVYKELKEQNLPVIYHPTPRSVYMLLRTNVLFVASTAWIKKLKYHLLFRAKKIQLFHGLALKKVELAIPRRAQYNNSFKGKVDNALRGRFPLYDIVISTSDFFTDALFAEAFRSKEVLVAGYPRIDSMLRDGWNENELLGADREKIELLEKLRAAGKKIVLYAPTFRDSGGDAVTDRVLELDSLSEFAEKHGIIFVFKLHISTKTMLEMEKYKNIVQYDNSSDIQPLLKISDILITDYSSICMDFLLLERPMLFFPYDYDKYVSKDRELLFDYDWITAGPKCHSQQQLQDKLSECIKGQDDFAAHRKEIRELVFTYRDTKASERIWNYTEQKYISITDLR